MGSESFPNLSKERASSADLPYDLSIPGWMDEPELIWLSAQAHEMESIVEIGCFQGRSTFAFLKNCRAGGVVHAIDTWQPMWGNGIETWPLFHQHLLERLTVEEALKLRVYRMRSDQAAVAFDVAGITADMVFIDSDHTYEACKSDIELWLPRTRKLICGHDLDHPDYPGVRQAVEEKFWSKLDGRPVFDRPAGSIWSVRLA